MKTKLNGVILGIAALTLIGAFGCAATTDTASGTAGGTAGGTPTSHAMADSTHAATPSSAVPDTVGKPH